MTHSAWPIDAPSPRSWPAEIVICPAEVTTSSMTRTRRPRTSALGQPCRAVSLGRLPHERARQAGPLPERRDHRDAAHLQARQHLGPFRNQRHHRIGKLARQSRIGLELVLVEVLVSYPARTQHEAARQPAAITNPASKICISHHDSIAGPDHRLTATLFPPPT